MKAARRRSRQPDPLARPEAVRLILNELRTRASHQIPQKDVETRRFLYAVLHVERFPASDTKRGRPAHWTRAEVIRGASLLGQILARETSGRISVKSFITAYLPLLFYPTDLTEALISEQINLFEAGLLARLTPDRLKVSTAETKRMRTELIRVHVASQGSQNTLRRRVKEILGETGSQQVNAGSMQEVVILVDELLEIDAADARHLFWEEMKTLFYAMREITPDDLDDETLEEFLAAIDGVSLVLHRIDKRRKDREQQLNELEKFKI